MSSDLEEEIDKIIKDRKKACHVQGIVVPQVAENPLWIVCVVHQKPLSFVSKEMNGSVDLLLRAGFNANFFQRHTWFDAEQLKACFPSVSGKDWFRLLSISKVHFLNLQMTEQEYKDLSLSFEDVRDLFGPQIEEHERRRLTDWEIKEEEEIEMEDEVKEEMKPVARSFVVMNGYKIPIN